MKQLLKLPLLLALLPLFSLLHQAHAADTPNVLVFLTDDQGWGDMGCYGHPEIKTPHLDAFAKQGMKFNQCYAGCSVCSPSRSAILTGRTPYRNGVWRWIPSGSQYHLRESEITLAEVLKEKGYATCHTGKWHLNGHFNSDKHPQPNDHGYDHWLATQNNASPHHMNPVNYVRNGEATGRIEGPSAMIAAKEALMWLEEKKPKDAPWFITVWTHEPHLPIESAPEYMAHYKHIDDEGIRQHHGNVTQIDAAFGALMAGLKRLGYEDDTLVIYTSDNGPEGRTGMSGRTRGSTGGLRGRKRATHEGGIRVPGLVRWPGQIPAGMESDVPVIAMDVFPTVCDIMNIPLPADRVIDGTSILPLFEGQPVLRKQPLYWRNHLASEDSRVGLRDGDWKVIGSDDLSTFELYNIADDWQEKANLAESHPEKFAAMRDALIAHDKAVLADGPDWWKNEKPREPRERKGKTPEKAKKGAALAPGKDATGSFAIVKGGTLSKDELGFKLESKGEALALQRFEKPVTERVQFGVRYTARTSSTTRNAMLVFGDSDDNNALVKVGTAIGMGAHSIFQGSWGNAASGKSTATFSADDTFAADVTVDLKKGTVTAVINGKAITRKLPKSLKKITHYGYYIKATSSAFSPIEIKI